MLRNIFRFGVLTFLVKLIAGQAGFGGSGTSVPGVCVCATTGSCSLAGGGAENDGTGQLDARILNTGGTSSQTGSMDNTGLGIVGTGIGLVAWTQSTCDAVPGLERCCPANGYTCGIRYPPVANAPQPQNGQASFGAYPFQAAILTSSNIYLGAGVAIDHFHVLTAAHKLNVSADARLKVRMGEWDISAGSEPIPFQEFMVLNATIHPQYNVGNLKNNIAILTLVSPIPLGQFPTMNNICLPNMTISNVRCMVAGWGKNDPITGTFQNVLKEVDLPIVAHSECQDMLRQTRLGQNFNLDPNCFVCAGGEAGKDACIGDGGAPLSCFIYDRFYLVGLTAWGIGCGKAAVPGVYVNIQTYVPWIQQFIASENRMAAGISTTRNPNNANNSNNGNGNGTTTTRRMSGGLNTTTAASNSSIATTAASNSTLATTAASNSSNSSITTTTQAANSSSSMAASTSAVNANVNGNPSSAASTAGSSSIIFTTKMASTSSAVSSSNVTTASSTNSSEASTSIASNSSLAANSTTKAPVAGGLTTPLTATNSNTTRAVANQGSTTKPAPVAGVITATQSTDRASINVTTSRPKTTVKKVRNTVKGARKI